MPRVLVTGANGHIGANLVRDLLAHDYEVVPMVRKGADLRGLHGLDLEYRYGDILDSDAVRAAVDGVEAVFHLAQPYDMAPKVTMEDMTRPAIEGTKNVFAAMADAGVKQVVYTSSVASVGVADDVNKPLTETSFNPQSDIPYTQAKIIGERTAMEMASEYGLDIRVTLPGGCIGRWDFKGTPTQEPIWDAVNGKGPAAFGVTFTDIRDVATGHRLALEKGRAGERYLVTADVMTPDETADHLAVYAKKRPGVSLPPKPVLMVAVTVLGWIGMAPITRDVVREVHSKHFSYDGSKARKELGFEPRTPQVALDECLRWGLYFGRLNDGVGEKVRAALPPEAAWAEVGAS